MVEQNLKHSGSNDLFFSVLVLKLNGLQIQWRPALLYHNKNKMHIFYVQPSYILAI